MKAIKRIRLAAVALAFGAGSAWADRAGRPHGVHPHGPVQFGVYVGAPLIYPPHYPYPPYWPRVYVPLAPLMVMPPPVYIEQQNAPAAAPTLEPGYWYYCHEAQAYFPEVKQCLGMWQKVAPQPSQ